MSLAAAVTPSSYRIRRTALHRYVRDKVGDIDLVAMEWRRDSTIATT
ncbi:hypothetical protein SRABI35_02787 [Stenotrophomonas lactitubi]|nr:hypothetical protein SRABI35_02787 [Stenotrophomonas lactitubi]